ncbi:MAG: sialidase family protein [Ktedonobacterales bacterium]
MRRSYPHALNLAISAAVAVTAALLATVGPMVATAAASTATVSSAHFSTQQRLGFRAGDDWEPALTTDRFGHEYALFKHYDVPGGGTCTRCDLHVLVQRSSDGGQSWSDPVAIAPVAAQGGQYDSQIAVDPVDGKTLWASFLQASNSRIAVVKSTDFGKTWSPLRIVSDLPPGLDKDTLVVHGSTVAVAYDDNFNTWVSLSRDGGRHWSTHLIFPGDNRFNISLSAGGGIDPAGNIFFTWDSFDKAHSANGDGPVTLWIARSTDGGLDWTRTVIAVSGAPYPCNACGYAFLSAQMTMRIGEDGALYLLWNATPGQTNGTPERIYFARSTDHGASYSVRQNVSLAPAGVEHCFPALATGPTDGDVRIGWMDERTGAWNLFVRSSSNGGTSWSAETRVSGYVPGYSYLTPAGFGLPYGDYFQMAVDSAGETQIAWGESSSYAGPGNIWTAHD